MRGSVPHLPISPPLPQPLRQRRRAAIVKAHAIQDGSIVNQPEQPGRGITGLGVAGDGSEFGKAKTKAGPQTRGHAIFVESGGQPDRVGEIHAPERLGQPIVLPAIGLLDLGLKPARRPLIRSGIQPAQQPQGLLVQPFRIGVES